MTPDEVQQVNATLGILVKLLISWVSGAVPILGTLLNLPIIGWVANLGINFMTNKLFAWVDQLISDKKIDDSSLQAVTAAKQANDALKNSKPGDSDHAQKLADFKASVSKLAHLNLVQS